MAETKYQTLHEFMQHPFGNSSAMANDRRMAAIYQRMNSEGVVSVAAYTVMETSYYIHLKIPSDSQKKQGTDYFYDVVIRFFTQDAAVKKENHLRNYKIQFYSNSPSFMYQYAYLYNQKGFLIADLYGKTDVDFIHKPPTKRNPDMNINYDKSIYVCCRFLADRQFRWLEKHGVLSQKRVSYQRFFNSINDFKGVKFEQALLNEERKLARSLSEKDAPDEDDKKIKASTSSVRDKTAKPGITVKSKIKPTRGKKTTAKYARVIRGSRST